jgi:hypothetical protein
LSLLSALERDVKIVEDDKIEEEVYYYEDTPFHKMCDELSRQMSATLKNYGFTDKYLEYYHGNITKDELITYVRDTLGCINETMRHDLNHLWSMLSTKNCGWYEYEAGQIIHDELLRIWYPEDYK